MKPRSRTPRIGMWQTLFTGIFLLVACGGGETRGRDGDGTIRLSLNGNGPTHDVVEVRFLIVDAADPDGCAGAVLAESTAGIEAEPLPSSLDPDGGGGDLHAFADALFVLPPGAYRACATPLDAASSPSSECSPTEGLASVVAQETTEIVLISECQGDPNGAIDVVVGLNDPPRIDDLDVTPSKFITTCETASVTVTASDPNGDPLDYGWSVDAAPAGANPSLGDDGLGGATFETDLAGDYELSVVVADAHGAEASLSFPVHVSDCPAPGSLIWSHSFGTSADAGVGVATDSSDHVLVAGLVSGGGNTDIWVGKYDANGALLWTQTHGEAPGGNDLGLGAATDASDNVFVSGQVFDATNADSDAWLRKYDTDGAALWTRTFEGGASTLFRGVATDSAGNAVAAGHSGSNLLVRKYDASGALLWTVLEPGQGLAVATDSADNAIVGGSALVRKYDPAGVALWTQNPSILVLGVATDPSDSVLVTGHNFGPPLDAVVIKYDASGATLWTRTVDGLSDDKGLAVASDSAGNVFVTGQVQGDLWLRKYDPAGTELWTETLDGGSGSDEGIGIATDSAENALVTGRLSGGFVGKFSP